MKLEVGKTYKTEFETVTIITLNDPTNPSRPILVKREHGGYLNYMADGRYSEDKNGWNFIKPELGWYVAKSPHDVKYNIYIFKDKEGNYWYRHADKSECSPISYLENFELTKVVL